MPVVEYLSALSKISGFVPLAVEWEYNNLDFWERIGAIIDKGDRGLDMKVGGGLKRGS